MHWPLRAVDGRLDHAFAHVLSQAVMAVESQQGVLVGHLLGPAVGPRPALREHVAIAGQDGQPVAGVADPVGLGQVFGDVERDVVGNLLGPQQAAAEVDGVGKCEAHDASFLRSSPASASTSVSYTHLTLPTKA